MIETAAVRALRVAALHERVLLVEAGPGWGKTTAVRTAFPQAQYFEVPPGDRMGALHAAILATFGLSVVDAGRVASRLAVDPGFVNDTVASAIPTRSTLIVDDVHRLNPEGVALMETLAERSGIHLVLVGRSMATLPVGTWIARGRAGMPMGLDTLAFRADEVREILGDGSNELPGAIVAAFGGWPIAATLASSLLRRGVDKSEIVSRLREGVAAVAGSVVFDVPYAERALLVEMALMAAYGLRPTPAHVALLRRLGFPESAFGPHEVIAAALLAQVEKVERVAAAARVPLDLEQAPALFALLAAEAPDLLRQRAWEFLPLLYDRYDGETLQQFAAHGSIDATAIAAARCFLLALRSQFSEAGALAERILKDAAARSSGAALRLSRLMLIAGRGEAAIPVVRKLRVTEPAERVLMECLLGSILDRRQPFVTAMEIASKSGKMDLIATASIFAAYRAVRAGELDDAEGFAARGEDAARASGSVLQQARALKIRYGVAMLRADLDVAAVHAGRLTTLQAYVSDPNERASDLAAALEVEVFAGRAARALAFDDAIRRAGHGWLDMETYVICRAITDAWDGRLLEATDRLAAFNSLLEAAGSSRLPLALAAYFAAAAGATGRSDELLAMLPNHAPPADPFARSHYEIAASFSAMAESMLQRPAAAARRLKAQAKTAVGRLFLDAARGYVGSGDVRAYADAMRKAGFDGIARAVESSALEAPRGTLSAAERDVLTYLARGLGAARIAELTGRSVHTIRNHRRSIVGKLGASSTFEAIAIARRRGLLQE